MADIGDLREGLSGALDQVDGLRSSDLLLDQINPPVAMIQPEPFDFDAVLGSGEDPVFRITILVSRTSERGAQKKLDSFLAFTGPTSIKAALEQDKTLSGVCADWYGLKLDRYGWFEVGSVIYLGAELVVTVMTS